MFSGKRIFPNKNKSNIFFVDEPSKSNSTYMKNNNTTKAKIDPNKYVNKTKNSSSIALNHLNIQDNSQKLNSEKKATNNQKKRFLSCEKDKVKQFDILKNDLIIDENNPSKTLRRNRSIGSIKERRALETLSMPEFRKKNSKINEKNNNNNINRNNSIDNKYIKRSN